MMPTLFTSCTLSIECQPCESAAPEVGDHVECGTGEDHDYGTVVAIVDEDEAKEERP